MKEEKSDFELVKNKISDIKIKNGFNSKAHQETKEQIILSSKREPYKNNKLKLSSRPHSNFLPKYYKKNMAKPTKVNNYNLMAIGYTNYTNNKILNLQINNNSSKILLINEKGTNTPNNNNKNINGLNQFNLPEDIDINKQNQTNMYNKIIYDYYFTSPIKKNKNNLTDNKNIIPKNLYNNQINRYLSPKIYLHTKNKNLSNNEKIISKRCTSPSTTNNSYTNNTNMNNSYSTHFIFGNSFIANIVPNNMKNNLNNKFNNEKNIDGNNFLSDNKNDNNVKMTAIEYQLNQLLAKKGKINKIKDKNGKLLNKNESFNVEEIYLNYANKIDEISLKESIIQNNYNHSFYNKIDKNTNTSFQNSNTNINNYNYNNFTNTMGYINTNNNNNTNNNLNYKYTLTNKFKNNNSKKKLISNPIIKYSFFDKIINNITRKVNFVSPNSEKEFDLSISKALNEEFFNNNINQNNYKDFITFGYELTPQKLLKIKELYNKNIQKEIEEENNNKAQNIKKNKRPTSSFFLSQNKNYISYRNINKINNNNIEESKNINKEKERIILTDKKNNDYNKFYLLDNNINNISTRNSFQINNNNYEQTQIYTNPNIDLECLGESSLRNKLDWNLISESDKEKGRILWKKITNLTNNNTNKKTQNKEIKVINNYQNVNMNSDNIVNKRKSYKNYIKRIDSADKAKIRNYKKENNDYKISKEINDDNDIEYKGDNKMKKSSDINIDNSKEIIKRDKRFCNQKLENLNMLFLI